MTHPVKAEDPRANQKARTRAAIIAAARELQRQGTPPTVEQAAEQARVSRATAYRYFPTKEALLVEISDITPALVPVEALLASFATGDAEQRLLVLLDTFYRIVLADEEHVRIGERVYLDTWLRAHRNGDDAPVVREGRRMRWLETVLAPLDDLSPERKRLLQAALALTLGPQAIFTMKDVCRLDDEEALAVLRWAATALLHAALEQAPNQQAAAPDGSLPESDSSLPESDIEHARRSARNDGRTG
jgi:AcrR family transcriptional regulator